MRKNQLSVNGFNFYYSTIENNHSLNEPVFLISGAFQNMNSWKNYANFLAKDRTVILADFPGTGDSDFLPFNIGFDIFIDCINAILNDLNVLKISIVSASYGTPIGYLYSKFFPNRVNKLVLAGTMEEFPLHLRERIEVSLGFAKQNKMLEFSNYVVENGFMCRDPRINIKRRLLVERLIGAQLRNMSFQDTRKYIHNTQRILNMERINVLDSPDIQTLVFTGEHDVFTFPEANREIAIKINQSVFTSIKEADHLFHIEDFSAVSKLLQYFLNGIPLELVENCNEIEYFMPSLVEV